MLHAQQRTPSINIESVTSPAERARLIVKKILDVDGRSSLAIQLKEDRNIKNALAWMDGQTRVIKYNPDYLLKFEKDALTKSAMFSLFAHELGHFVLPNQDIQEKDCARKKNMEIEADRYAGRIMNMLCFDLNTAVLAFQNMDPDVASGCYPRQLVREATVKKGWIDQNSSYNESGQRHPCDVPPFALSLQEKDKKNHSQNVQGKIIGGNILEVKYFLPPDHQNYKIFFAANPLAPIRRPSKPNIEWSPNPEQTGTTVTMRWYFGKDGLLVDEVLNKTHWFGILAVRPHQAPKPLKNAKKSLFIVAIAASAASLGYGVYLNNKAMDKHKIYCNNRDPNNKSVYAQPEDRDKLYRESNLQNKVSLGLIGVGGAGTTIFTILFKKRYNKDKRYKAMFLIAAP